MSGLRTGFRYTEDETAPVRTFLKKKKLVWNSMGFLTNAKMSFLPFEVWRVLFDNIQPSAFDKISQSIADFDNTISTNLIDLLESIQAWCKTENKKRDHIPKNERLVFFSRFEESENKIEWSWCHNMGVSTNNFSKLYLRSLELGGQLNGYSIGLNFQCGIKQMYVTFDKLK